MRLEHHVMLIITLLNYKVNVSV